MRRRRASLRVAPLGLPKVGNQVDQLRAMFRDHALEHIHLHAVGVDRRTDDIRSVEPEALDRRQEGRGLDDDLVAGGNHRLADQVQRLLAAGGDDQPVGCQRWRPWPA
jgi:hypothetical protein